MRSISRGSAAWLSLLFCNKNYLDGSKGPLYRGAAPLVNVSRAPGEWQSYPMILHAPQRRARRGHDMTLMQFRNIWLRPIPSER